MVFHRFRWVFCQLEVLRNCLPQNVQRVLRELPNSLDETYERVLKEIGKVNPDQAYRLLQCLTVATRPLRVDELAEVLALDFDGAQEGIPTLNSDWRWDDEQQGVLSTCSSLIVVVDDESSRTRVVQFAHFSVKEFLTSDRLANAANLTADVSRFHICLEPAHMVIAQACLAILLHSNRVERNSPLSDYAARHWVGHAQFENVSLGIEDGMRRLFDPTKPHFATWLKSFNIDTVWYSFVPPPIGAYLLDHPLESISSSEATASLCLYYAALCGFRDLTKLLIAEYPQHVNARVGRNKSPLAAALSNKHIQVAELLHQHGAVLHIGYERRTLLHAVSLDGSMDVVEWLLNIGADANVQQYDHTTPLHLAAAGGHLGVVRMLLGYGADVHVARTMDDCTPLHNASRGGHVDIVRLLIQNGADASTDL
ncbi:ankyrin repeat-containing domain protein [Lactarius akahatsu]|uniref:Ankyrin repeat-containing domain protein n=1 Tax=Lactarius akahatsu TaxID=416441 RepID=A0AAD4Q9R1_9AGAM|nr:ankyrin repeat-containing domain protein [Lactarius akahatsu]